MEWRSFTFRDCTESPENAVEMYWGSGIGMDRDLCYISKEGVIYGNQKADGKSLSISF